MNLKPIIGWSLYDLANTSFSALFITLFFPLFITVYLGGNEFHVGLVFGIAFLLSGLFVPIIGALADAWGRKIRMLFLFTILSVTATFFVGYVNLIWAIILGIAATFFFHASLDIYDALMIDISPKKFLGTISGIGVAAGYLGAVLSLAMAYVIMQMFGWESKQAVQLIFPATALFFLFFAVISFFLMKEKKSKPLAFAVAIKKAIMEVKTTVTNVSKFKNVFMFLISSLLYTDSLNIAIIFFYLYARQQIGLELQSFFFLFGAMAVAAAVGALVVGKITDKVGAKNSLILTQLIWIITIIILIFSNTLTAFIIAGILGSLALGGVWTATRPMLIKLAPKHKVAEFLGFQGLTEKFSGGIGPILFGGTVVLFGYQFALLIPLIFMIAALLILNRVKY